jgi:hypothetical protein
MRDDEAIPYFQGLIKTIASSASGGLAMTLLPTFYEAIINSYKEAKIDI